MTALPQISRFIDSNITEGDFKVALSELRDYLNGLLGEDGTPATAGKKLNLPMSGVLEKTQDCTATSADKGKVFRFTGTSAMTLSLDAAMALGDGWNITVINDSSADLVIDPYAGETIDGQETYVLKAQGRAGVVCDGTRCYTTVPAVPDTVANAGYATSAGYADSAGSVAGISNPMSRDAGAGGIGSIIWGVPTAYADVYPGGTVGGVTAIAEGSNRVNTQLYGGTWRNIGARSESTVNRTTWQRIA